LYCHFSPREKKEQGIQALFNPKLLKREISLKPGVKLGLTQKVPYGGEIWVTLQGRSKSGTWTRVDG
jgi:hypothetical protein